MNVIRSVIALAALVLASCAASPAFAQDKQPDQIILAGVHYTPDSTPNLSGFVGYGKKVTDSLGGTYSYTLIRETSIALKPKPQLKTSTETGLAIPIGQFASWKILGVGAAGIAAAGSQTGTSAGFSASGMGMAEHAIGRGFFVGIAVGPTYSTLKGDGVSYQGGIVLGFGKP